MVIHFHFLIFGLDDQVSSHIAHQHVSSKQVDLTLDEILSLQEEGPSDNDISTILEIEQRAHENGVQVNFIQKIAF